MVRALAKRFLFSFGLDDVTQNALQLSSLKSSLKIMCYLNDHIDISAIFIIAAIIIHNNYILF